MGAVRPWEKVSSIFANSITNYLYLYVVLLRGVYWVSAIMEHSVILLTVLMLVNILWTGTALDLLIQTDQLCMQKYYTY